MKKITCAQLGGPCDHAMIVADKEELMTKSLEHIKEAHPEIVATVENLDAVWDESPETPEEHDAENVLIMDEEK